MILFLLQLTTITLKLRQEMFWSWILDLGPISGSKLDSVLKNWSYVDSFWNWPIDPNTLIDVFIRPASHFRFQETLDASAEILSFLKNKSFRWLSLRDRYINFKRFREGRTYGGSGPIFFFCGRGRGRGGTLPLSSNYWLKTSFLLSCCFTWCSVLVALLGLTFRPFM